MLEPPPPSTCYVSFVSLIYACYEFILSLSLSLLPPPPCILLWSRFCTLTIDTFIFQPKKGGGVSFNSMVTLTKTNERMVQMILHDYSIFFNIQLTECYLMGQDNTIFKKIIKLSFSSKGQKKSKPQKQISNIL